MSCRQTKCCCCIPIKTGTYIIGGIHAIYLLLFVSQGDYLGAALNFFAGSTFLFMVFRDSSFTRGLFFAAFFTYVLTVVFLNLYFTFFMLEEDKVLFDIAVREKCEAFQAEEGGFEETPFTDMDECV